MAWPTFKDSTISLILVALIIQTLASTQDKYSNTINRPISEIYSKNRENENPAQYRQNNTSEQNINTRHFSNIPYNSNYVPGYNPYQYQQPNNFGYPGGLNFQGANGFGYQGSGYPGTAVGFPGGGGLSTHPGIGLGNQGVLDEKGLLFPLPIGQYPQLSSFKPSFQQTNPFGIQQGFGGFYPNYPVLPTQQVNFNQQQIQGQQNYYPVGGTNQSPHNAFDIGSLPRQVRVPGNIQANIIGKDAEIICEFPRYLLLVQGIYWHHRYDAFGSYFDTQNRFGPRITVQAVDQWKSVLRITGFNEDDFGIYRCLSAAALPTDDKPVQFPGEFATRTGQLPSSTTPVYSGNSQEYDSGESQSREERVKKRKNARRMKFPPTRKLRFSRQSDDDENSLDQFQDDQVPSATDSSAYFPNTNEPYDPFVSNRNQPGHLRNGYLDYNQQNSLNNNNYRYPVTLSQNPFIPNLQTPRHLPPGFANYPGFDYPTTTFANSQTPIGLQVPYYKPSYSIYTVFQETVFQPTGGLRSSSTSSVASTSARPLKPKTG